MFLKNVPPVVALHTEWRSYGPTRNFSLPLCFNDSDSDISTTGTPIPEKVQMIIDSLRSTQSSIDMSDEYEGTLHSGQAPLPGCTGKTDVVHKARHRGAMGGVREDKQPVDSMEFSHLSPDSDSDDSVDRGIEEAIQEYLKEKGDYKRKLEPAASPSQVPKHPKRELPVSDTPKNSDSNKILTASSNHIPKRVRATHSVATEKKRIRNDRTNEGNPLPLKKGDINKAVKKSLSFETKKDPGTLTSHPSKGQNIRTGKLEDESPESSSDDGIEEAIRHYQQEKKKENSEGYKKPYNFDQPNEESDSSSDDGIEEAIRRYQQEMQKEKSKHVTKVSKLSQPKQTPGSKAPALYLDQSGIQAIKRQKVFTKKKKIERNFKPLISTPVASCYTLSRPEDNPDIKDNGVSATKNKYPSERPTPAHLKVNTTAELMCAEAILDISKAVMPEAFNHSAALPNNCIQSDFHSQDSINCLDRKSDESSVDSDDGIEQEIRKFLELKAQMHNQSSDTTSFACTPESAVEQQQQRKPDPSQDKKLRLSLSRKRKRKEESNVSKAEEINSQGKEEPHLQHLAPCDSNSIIMPQVSDTPGETDIALHVATTEKEEESTKNTEKKHSPISWKDAKDPGKEENSNPSSSVNEVSKSSVSADRRAQTGDKSSSLDSDEDLDAAIKDLLLTKKKVKKKVRDRKLKSRKSVHFGAEELCLVEELETEKKKALTEHKNISNPKVPKSCMSKQKLTSKQSTNGRSIKPKLKKSTSVQLKTDKQVKSFCQVEHTGQGKGHTDVKPMLGVSSLGATPVEEDSSSVDSDDSIEQEIRKFLAEKAKLSMVRTKDGEEISDSIIITTESLTEGGIKLAAQQAEIPAPVEAPCKGPPSSAVSGQPEILEGKDQSTYPGLEGHIPQSADKVSTPVVANTSSPSSGVQTDREVNTVKALNKSRASVKNSNTEKTNPDMGKGILVPEARPVSASSSTDPIYAHQVISSTEMDVHVSHSPFNISSPIPARVREVKETGISDLQGVISSHEVKCLVPSHEGSVLSSAPGNYENNIKNEFVEPSPRTTKTSTTAIPPFPNPTPVRQPGEHFLLGPARGDSVGQISSPGPAENVVKIKKDQPLFLELSSHGSNYVQIKNRDLNKGVDNKDDTRESDDHEREAGDIVREGQEECFDETGDESDERPSASQRSRDRKQFPRLCLSNTIDPGESIRPYIILSSAERNLRYSRRYIYVEDQQKYWIQN
ncbi:hypothetical protein JZ751_012385 [Albula glossodonta]|uniref:Protein phosphatase 1 regulatory subunit 26 N-terminal domain-containing protein n=1 Tax=Albula glossodonta TaxID=121402 RepID=A0A8T2PSI8_9TELE|nr:hypothetical protein JZ751_012385 [Albula glossodonta]